MPRVKSPRSRMLAARIESRNKSSAFDSLSDNEKELILSAIEARHKKKVRRSYNALYRSEKKRAQELVA